MIENTERGKKNLDTNIRDFKSYGINFKNLNNKKFKNLKRNFIAVLRSPEDLMILLDGFIKNLYCKIFKYNN